MSFASAFQNDAFQNDAFQIAVATKVRDEAMLVIVRPAPPEVKRPEPLTGRIRSRFPSPTLQLFGDVYPPEEGWLLGVDDGSDEAKLLV